MSRQAIKRTCPVCHGTGRPTGDKSFGESISGYCYKCHGSGEVTDYIDVPSSSSTSSSGGSGGGGFAYLFGVLLLFSLLFFAILAFVVIRALYKMFTAKDGFNNFLKLAAVVGIGYLLYGTWAVAFEPMTIGWDIPSPWHYFIILATAIPVVLFIKGEKKYKLLDGTWVTISNFFKFLFDSIAQSWQGIFGRTQG